MKRKQAQMWWGPEFNRVRIIYPDGKVEFFTLAKEYPDEWRLGCTSARTQAAAIKKCRKYDYDDSSKFAPMVFLGYL